MADLRATLTDIYHRNHELTPQIVVDEARPEGAPLHDRFEWDDSVAGEKYRCVQAQQLIRSVRIEYAEEDTTGERKFVRGFHSLRESGSENAGYVPVEELVQDDIAVKVLLRQCQREIADLKRKYGHLAEFAEMVRKELAA